jgi:integrase
MPRLTNKPLTERTIDNVPLPKAGMTEMRDATVRGLVVRIFPSGDRSWSLEYRSPVTLKSSRVAIEATSLAEARHAAQKHKLAIAEGVDPRHERKEALQLRRVAAAGEVLVPDALDKYEQPFLDKSPTKQASRRDRMGRLRRVLSPFNKRGVASITSEEMIGLLDDIQKASGPIARNRAHAEIRAWLGWLQPRGHVAVNVLDRVKKEISETHLARTRVLTDAELAAMMTATADGSEYSDIIRVLLHTGMRKGEAANMQPRDLDFDARTIKVRGEVSKTRFERTIPMPAALVAMLMLRIDGVARDGYIFGVASYFRSPFSGWGKCTDRLRAAMPEGDPWTMHDIRRTVATRLHSEGVDPLVIEDLLGHLCGARSGMAGVYNRAVTLAKQTEALKNWAAALAALAAPKVIPFERPAGRAQAIRQTR